MICELIVSIAFLCAPSTALQEMPLQDHVQELTAEEEMEILYSINEPLYPDHVQQHFEEISASTPALRFEGNLDAVITLEQLSASIEQSMDDAEQVRLEQERIERERQERLERERIERERQERLERERQERERQERLERERAAERREAERQAVAESAPAPKAPSVSGNAGGAVQAALSQVGVMYRWGGNTPAGFDCSGLTSWAWAQAGKSIPRTSSSQYAGLSKIGRGNLRPGDLIFYHSPISHVTMYIGNGQMVEASRAGVPVRVTSVRSGAVGYARP